ncbi:hypothetical protein BDSB_22725 [Burkholderia dolosa PC543]|nr:hypothetical protein BDSB_22725 [Burkholderia dolosa PC543]
MSCEPPVVFAPVPIAIEPSAVVVAFAPSATEPVPPAKAL